MSHEENVPEEKTKEWLAKGFGLEVKRLFVCNNAVYYRAKNGQVSHYLEKNKHGEFVFLPVLADGRAMVMISAPKNGDYLLPEEDTRYSPSKPGDYEVPPLSQSELDTVFEDIDNAEWIKKHLNSEEPFVTSGTKQIALSFMFEMAEQLKER